MDRVPWTGRSVPETVNVITCDFLNSSKNLTTSVDIKMQKSGVAACVLLLVVILLAEVAMATYRKPPFNGSIFGKRGTVVEYDAAGRALSAMCEIASEACSAWFPQSDNK